MEDLFTEFRYFILYLLHLLVISSVCFLPSIHHIIHNSLFCLCTQYACIRRGETVNDFEIELILGKSVFCKGSENSCVFMIKVTILLEKFLKCANFRVYLIEFKCRNFGYSRLKNFSFLSSYGDTFSFDSF